MASLERLPIDSSIPEILAAVRRVRAVVITAPPGAGKTTRVPPALVVNGPLLLLQPRRVAARAIARRIAEERGWTLGREIGWQIRFERRFTDATRLLVATEGVLTARLQRDPLLSEFTTIVLDEFHERSVYADVAIALAKQAWRARDDLSLVIMSATLDAAAVSRFLGDCPIVNVPGRQFPLDIHYGPQETVAGAAIRALAGSAGDVLCFLPGAAEIRRAIGDLQSRVSRDQVEVVPLHGSLDAAEQDFALAPSSSRRRVVVSTNIAETSLTVPRVTAVVDSGLHRVARYDAERGIDSLDVERIPADAADQRAGRAGRVAAGHVWRLWDAHDRLRPHREPEIHRVDLSGTLLDIIAWGGNPRTFEWFEKPSDESIDAALDLLERLGAIRAATLTDLGDRIRRLPIHPRLARMLIAAGGSRAMVQACALLSERSFIPPRVEATRSDLLSAIDEWRTLPSHVHAVAREIEQLWRAQQAGSSLVGAKSVDMTARAERVASPPRSGRPRALEGAESGAQPLPPRQAQDESGSEASFRRAVFAGYPDRVAQRREPGSPRVRLASGAGGVIGSDSGVRDGEFMIAIDVQSPSPAAHMAGPLSFKPARRQMLPAAPNDARIRVASAVDRDWLQPTGRKVVHRFDADAGKVRASRIDYYDALILAEHPTTPDSEVAAQLLAEAWLERGPGGGDEHLLRRLRFAGHTLEVGDLVRAAARLARSLEEVNLGRALPIEVSRALDRDAPESLRVPSGRIVPLEYTDEGGVAASVKLQELFGLAETPRIGIARAPVVFSLLAPNGRPVQVTRDLRSFWERTYPEVRKQLRGRYPKHPWPEDPWTATPTGKLKGKR